MIEKSKNSHRVAAWNLEKGGFDEYSAQIDKATNLNLQKINDFAANLNADTLIVSDAQGFADPDLRSKALAGFEQTFFTPLEDQSLINLLGDDWKNLGVAVATNSPVAEHKPIDLDGRQASLTTLNIGRYGLRIAGVYLYHELEEKRSAQVRALISHLKKEDVPTVIAGDFNAQQPLCEVGGNERARSKMILLGAQILKIANFSEVARLIDLERRLALGQLSRANFINACDDFKPTALTPAPKLFRVDHIYHDDHLQSENYQRHNSGKLSDHDAISADIKLP